MVIRGRKFPANDITLDNYIWAVRTYGLRWSGWNLTAGNLMRACRDLRRDAMAGRL